MSETAKKFVAAWKREQTAKVIRRELAERLMPTVKNRGPIVVGGVQVILDSSNKKCPTKQQLVDAFGDAGAAFWDNLVPSLCQYLTVVPAKSKKKTG